MSEDCPVFGQPVFFGFDVLSIPPQEFLSLNGVIFISNARRDTRVNGSMKIDNISQSGVTMKSITITFSYSDQYYD